MPLNSLMPALSMPRTLPALVSATQNTWPLEPVPRPAGGDAAGGACADAAAAPTALAATPAAAMRLRRLIAPRPDCSAMFPVPSCYPPIVTPDRGLAKRHR